jgi:putative PIN family toxin of toxin-antitoxin system
VILVLDTNVLVSGLLSPFGAPGEIVRLVSSGILTLCYEARILAEYREVLQRPAFPFTLAQVEALLDQIQAGGQLVNAHPLPAPLPDPDDEVFLAAALAGQAQYLVTGNLKHYPAGTRQGVRVVLPADFLAWYRKREEVDPAQGCPG